MAEEITIQLNDESLKVPSGITVKKALELSGYKVTKFPEIEALFVPCEVGGYWSCAVLICQRGTAGRALSLNGMECCEVSGCAL